MGYQAKVAFGLTKDSQFSSPTLAADAAWAFVCLATPQEQTFLQIQYICADQGPAKEIFHLFCQATAW